LKTDKIYALEVLKEIKQTYGLDADKAVLEIVIIKDAILRTVKAVKQKRPCRWCGGKLPDEARFGARFCCGKCRVYYHRFRDGHRHGAF
jgi:hypothetical protein